MLTFHELIRWAEFGIHIQIERYQALYRRSGKQTVKDCISDRIGECEKKLQQLALLRKIIKDGRIEKNDKPV